MVDSQHKALRLFIAFDTPAPVKSRAQEIIHTLRTANADVSWERDEKMHCTLKFLGDTDSDRISEIHACLDHVSASHLPFRIAYRSLGFFPNAREPRIVWIGIEELDGSLHQLQESIDVQLASLGFETEKRSFHPHLTLGRIRSVRNQRQLIATTETLTFASEPYVIDSFSLMRSDLRPTGSVYKQEKSFSLIGKP